MANARKWVLLSGLFEGRRLWTALAVVQALGHATALTGRDTAAMGERWLCVSAGLVCQDSVREALHMLREIDGSPVQLVAGHTGLVGDEYRLVTPSIDGHEVVAAEWEAYAVRLDPIDPAWSELGRGAWHVWETIRSIEQHPGARLTRRVIAAAARIGMTAVDTAIEILTENGLIDAGHGWIARTTRTVRQLGDLTQRSDERKRDRHRRHLRERRIWHTFLGIVTNALDTSGFGCSGRAATLPHYLRNEELSGSTSGEDWWAAIMAEGP